MVAHTAASCKVQRVAFSTPCSSELQWNTSAAQHLHRLQWRCLYGCKYCVGNMHITMPDAPPWGPSHQKLVTE